MIFERTANVFGISINKLSKELGLSQSQVWRHEKSGDIYSEEELKEISIKIIKLSEYKLELIDKLIHDLQKY